MAMHLGLGDTEVRPTMVDRRAERGQGLGGRSCACGLARRAAVHLPLRPHGLSVPKPPIGSTTWWGGLVPRSSRLTRARQLARRGPEIQNSVNKVQDSTRIDNRVDSLRLLNSHLIQIKDLEVTDHPVLYCVLSQFCIFRNCSR